MSFSYHQLDDDGIESIGSVQVPNSQESTEDQTFCPQRPLLRRWPLCLGILEIIVGFISAGLGAVYIFLTPLFGGSLDPSGIWELSKYNSFGAALWSGIMLVFSGILAVRASRWKTILNVHYFYVVSCFSFLFNLAMMILILWSYQQRFATHYTTTRNTETNKDEIHFLNCYFTQDLCKGIEKYSVISLLSSISCIVGCQLLAVAVARYFMDVMFGEVQLVKSFITCCIPCCVPYCKLPPSKSSSRQSVDIEEPNMIV